MVQIILDPEIIGNTQEKRKNEDRINGQEVIFFHVDCQTLTDAVIFYDISKISSSIKTVQRRQIVEYYTRS